MIEQLKNGWANLPLRSRFGVLFGGAVICALLLGGGYWVFRENYQVLFSELSPQDAGAMVTELDRMKVSYRLAEGGTVILVEQDTVYKTRLKLMSKGLNLQGAVGFEIFNNTDLGMTEFAQKVNFQRALQGELARTIMGFDEVKAVRVHLVMPEGGLFKRKQAKPKASISLAMRPGSHLSAEQVSGIQQLVAASVPEIDPAAVTVVDQHGIAVSKAQSDDGAPDVGDRLEAKRQVEEYLSRKLLAILDRVVGTGRAIVSVDVAIAYDQVKVTREDVLPATNSLGQNVGAISRRRETAQGGDPVSDQSFLANGINTSGRSTGTVLPVSSSSEVEYANGRRVEQVVSLPGAIKRLTVGVMVPGMTDPVELAKLKEVITMAVGVTPSRGDAIVVYSHPGKQGTGEEEIVSGGRAEDTGDTVVEALGVSNAGESETLWVALWGLAVALMISLFYSLLNRKPVVGRKGKGRRDIDSSEYRAELLDEIVRWASAGKGR